MPHDAGPSTGDAGPTRATRLPGSLIGDVFSDTLSPVKSSPSKSPMKQSPGPSAQVIILCHHRIGQMMVWGKCTFCDHKRPNYSK